MLFLLLYIHVIIDGKYFSARTYGVVQPNISPFNLIIRYIKKIIPTLQEQDQFVMYISHVYFDLFKVPSYDVSKISISTIRFFLRYTSVFKCCYHDIELFIVPYLGRIIRQYVHFEGMYIFPQYQHTQRTINSTTIRQTLPFYHLRTAKH